MESLNIKISTFNARGLRDAIKREVVFSWLKKSSNTIHFLQETHSTPSDESRWTREWGGTIIFGHGLSNSRGVAILFDNNINIEILKSIHDNTGRLIVIKCKINEIPYDLINVYCPTKDNESLQLAFLNFIEETLEMYGETNVILGGDFNTTLNPKLDKKGGTIEKISNYANKLIFILEAFSLVDVWRVRNPSKYRYTRREKCKGGMVLSRLNYIFISKNLEYITKNIEIKPGVRSDHNMIIISINFINEQARGKGFWKMNIKHLSDKKYLEHLTNSINRAKIDSITLSDKHKKWEYIKCIIRTESINYSILKSKEYKDTEKNLINKISALEEKIDDSSCISDNSSLEELSIVKKELEFLYNEKAKGAIIRSRCQWLDENEKCTKFFLKQEKTNYNIKYIKSLCINNNLITDPVDILESERKFYENLYHEDCRLNDTHIENFLKDIDGPKISEESRIFCDENITENEIVKAIKDLPCKKAPGPDGIPIDFYKIFWNDIKDVIIENFNISKINKALPKEQRKGIINLIPKEGKDIRELKNWRPITLLNSDYKILTKVLANRLKNTLPEIIDTDQIGYMKERFCGENTRLIADIIEYSILYKHPGIILLIDFEKAFDTIKWSFLYKVLEYFNFGPNFIDWIKILYKDIFSCVTNNGYASTDISISRGIRQGDPISALLFLPVAEILALLIRNNKFIKGYMFYDVELKLCQLADDTTLFLCDNESVRVALKTFEEFYRYAGLKLNITKTEAIIVYNDGSLHNDKHIDIQWNDKPFKTLGIWYSLDINEMLEINLLDKLRKMQSLLNLWSGRCLSLKGKITVIKSIVMPHILHIASALYINEEVAKKIDKMFYDFLWSNRKHGISKQILEQSIEMGGLKMINIHHMLKSVKIMWIKRLTNSLNAKWKYVSWKLIGLPHSKLFSKLNLEYINCEIAFYRQVLDCWYSLISIEPNSAEEVLDENLFDNRFILIDNKPIGKEFNMLKTANVLKIKDLLEESNLELLDNERLNEKYNINLNFLLYNSLKSAIPNAWIYLARTKSKKNINNLHVGILAQKDLSKITNKKVYKYILGKNPVTPQSQEKWIESYPFLEKASWEEIYKIPFQICRDTYIQSLQFKILHRYLNCNYNLHKWCIKDSPLCDYCDSIDTIMHFLYECKTTKTFWIGVQNWFRDITNVDITFTGLEIVFGILVRCDINFIRNYIILQGKRYIYENKMKKKQLFLLEFLFRLKTLMLTEREIYSTEGKTTEFDVRFGIMEDFIY